MANDEVIRVTRQLGPRRGLNILEGLEKDETCSGRCHMPPRRTLQEGSTDSVDREDLTERPSVTPLGGTCRRHREGCYRHERLSMGLQNWTGG